MHLFERAAYEPLPAEEKLVDQEDTSFKIKSSRWSKKYIVLIVTFVSLFALLPLLVRAKVWTTSVMEEPVENSKKLNDYLARASGDQYLLGVGKGDITGYVLDLTRVSLLTSSSDLS